MADECSTVYTPISEQTCKILLSLCDPLHGQPFSKSHGVQVRDVPMTHHADGRLRPSVTGVYTVQPMTLLLKLQVGVCTSPRQGEAAIYKKSTVLTVGEASQRNTFAPPHPAYPILIPVQTVCLHTLCFKLQLSTHLQSSAATQEFFVISRQSGRNRKVMPVVAAAGTITSCVWPGPF